MSVNDQLARITNSPPLASSPSLCRFLRYIVKETLAGRASGIKEQVLGLEVFDRGNDFNPRLDPIVRVQARNLRSRIQRYYDGPGKNDPIRIELPKGTYIPLFHQVASVDGAAPESGNPPAITPVSSASESARPAASGTLESSAAPVTTPGVIAAGSVMPAPPPRSPVADKPQVRPRFMVASLIVMLILAGVAAVWISRTQAATAKASIRDSQAQDLLIGGRSEAQNMLARFGCGGLSEGMEKARGAARKAVPAA